MWTANQTVCVSIWLMIHWQWTIEAFHFKLYKLVIGHIGGIVKAAGSWIGQVTCLHFHTTSMADNSWQGIGWMMENLFVAETMKGLYISFLEVLVHTWLFFHLKIVEHFSNRLGCLCLSILLGFLYFATSLAFVAIVLKSSLVKSIISSFGHVSSIHQKKHKRDFFLKGRHF